MVETKEAVAKPLTKEKAEGEKGEEQVEEETKEVEEKKVEKPIAVEKEEPIEKPTPTEQIGEEAVEEAEEVAPEVPEEKTEIAEEVKKGEEKEAVVRPWRKRRRRGSRAVSGVTKEDFMGFARKYYPALVKDFEAERIPFDELKAKIERDVGLVWVDLKE